MQHLAQASSTSKTTPTELSLKWTTPHSRKVKEANSLPDHSIQKARWIKLIGRRCIGQTQAHAVLSLTKADIANCIIKEGLNICEARIRANKKKQEPLQCLNAKGGSIKPKTARCNWKPVASAGKTAEQVLATTRTTFSVHYAKQAHMPAVTDSAQNSGGIVQSMTRDILRTI